MLLVSTLYPGKMNRFVYYPHRQRSLIANCLFLFLQVIVCLILKDNEDANFCPTWIGEVDEQCNDQEQYNRIPHSAQNTNGKKA